MSNNTQPDNELDLHGLTRDDALGYLQDFIRVAQENKLQSIRVITGRGEGILQKAVLVYAFKEGYAITPEQPPDGSTPAVFVIHLP